MAEGGSIGPVNIIVNVPTQQAKDGMTEIENRHSQMMNKIDSRSAVKGNAWDKLLEDALQKFVRIEQAAESTGAKVTRAVSGGTGALPFTSAISHEQYTDPIFQRVMATARSDRTGGDLLSGGRLPESGMVIRSAMQSDAMPRIGNLDQALEVQRTNLAAQEADRVRRAAIAQEQEYIANGGMPMLAPKMAPAAYLPNLGQNTVQSETYALQANPGPIRMRPVDPQSRLAAEREVFDRSQNQAWFRDLNKSERKGVRSADNDMESTRQELGQLPVRQVEMIEKHFERLVMEGKDFNKELQQTKNYLDQIGRSQPSFGPAPAAKGEKTPGGWWNRVMGTNEKEQAPGIKGENARQFRYVTQNVAYGFEDALTSYNMVGGGAEGARMAARAASNNVSAFGTMFKNPTAGAAFIGGTAVAAAAVGPVADMYEKAFDTANGAGERFAETLDKIYERTERLSKAEFKIRDIDSRSGAISKMGDYNDDVELDKRKLSTARSKRQELLAQLDTPEMREVAGAEKAGDSLYGYVQSAGAFSQDLLTFGGAGQHSVMAKRDKYFKLLNELEAADTSVSDLSDSAVDTAGLRKQLRGDMPRIGRIEDFNDRIATEDRAFKRELGKLDTPTAGDIERRYTEYYGQREKQIAENKDIPEDARKIALNENRREMQSEMSDAMAEATDDAETRRKKHLEIADELSAKMEAEVDARQGIIASYNRQADKIRELSGLTDEEKEKLLKENSQAMASRLEDYDKDEKKKRRKAETHDKTLGGGVEVGSSADVEMRQKLQQMGSDTAKKDALTQRHIAVSEQQLREVRETNRILKTGLPRAANIRR